MTPSPRPSRSSSSPKPPRPLTPRDAAWETLTRFESPVSGARKAVFKADALLDAVFASPAASGWGSADRRQCTALVYGVLRRWLPYEARLKTLSRFPLTRLDPAVRALLRLGLFQLLDCDDTPDYAALNETVAQARGRRLSKGSVAFINGVLRAAQRQQAAGEWSPPTFEADAAAHLEQAWNLPAWLASRWLEQFGPEATRAMAQAMAHPPPLTVRVNALRTSAAEFRAQLAQAGVAGAESDDAPDASDCLTLEGFYGAPADLPGFAQGAFFVQDVNAARVAHWVAPRPGETVLDLCAAPGGKTTHLAALMRNEGRILAIDAVESRLARLRENAARLDARIIEPMALDVLDDASQDAFARLPLADRVLVDAPCSGLGTLRRRPDVLRRLSARDLPRYADKQRALLLRGLSKLKPGGSLVYATCSLDACENSDVTRAALALEPGVSLEDERQFPITPRGDGFYIARLRRASGQTELQ